MHTAERGSVMAFLQIQFFSAALNVASAVNGSMGGGMGGGGNMGGGGGRPW